MESDGRIRSKDIGTGEVNSRVIDDLRSSNYDGSHTDPENDPGLVGWQILKSGFMVINNAVVRGTIAAARIVSAIISGGEVNITEGGKLTVGGDPDVPTPPLVTLDETGLQVGTDVVIDSTGLSIEGVLQPAFWPFTASGSAADVSLTTTATDFVTLTIEPPDWVQQLHLISFLRVQMSASATHNVRAGLTNDDGGASSQRANGSQTVPNGQTGGLTIPNRETIPLSPAGRDVDIVADASVNSGTNSSNLINLSVLGFGTRV